MSLSRELIGLAGLFFVQCITERENTFPMYMQN